MSDVVINSIQRYTMLINLQNWPIILIHSHYDREILPNSILLIIFKQIFLVTYCQDTKNHKSHHITIYFLHSIFNKQHKHYYHRIRPLMNPIYTTSHSFNLTKICINKKQKHHIHKHPLSSLGMCIVRQPCSRTLHTLILGFCG